MSIAIVIPVCGNLDHWMPLAYRAEASAQNQTSHADEVQVVVGDTVADARNKGIQAVEADYIICLDADDELDRSYVEVMREAVKNSDPGEWLYQPSTLGVVDGKEDKSPYLIPRKPLDQGNFMVIGTMFSRELFLEVGMFKEWAAYEDWDLFIRMHQAGAQFQAIPEAIYRVNVNPEGRNLALSPAEQGRLFREIRSQYY